MPKLANPLTKISKRLDALKSKSEKLAKEISDLSLLVAAETYKAQNSLPVGKKVQATDNKISKKHGRPPKASKVSATVVSSTGMSKVKNKK